MIKYHWTCSISILEVCILLCLNNPKPICYFVKKCKYKYIIIQIVQSYAIIRTIQVAIYRWKKQLKP